MSLIVTANEVDTDLTRYTNHQAPEHYTNHLKQTLLVEPNSEVAIQSVKVNKDGLIRISPGDAWFQFFNQNMRTNAADPLIDTSSKSTGMPIRCSPKLNNPNMDEYVNIEEFANRVQQGMRIGLPHPDMLGGTTASPETNEVLCQVARDVAVAGKGFKGFQFTFDYMGQATVDVLPTKYRQVETGGVKYDQMTITNAGGPPITSTNFEVKAGNNASPYNVAWGIDNPISHLNGDCIYDLKGLSAAGDGASYNKPFTLGIARGTLNKTGQIPYLDVDDVSYAPTTHFYDYAISCHQRVPGGDFWLHCGHAVVNNGGTGVAMREIHYFDGNTGVPNVFPGSTWKAASATGHGRYNLSTNTAGYTHLKIVVDGEKVKFSVGVNNAAYVTLFNYNLRDTAAAPKESCPKPAGQNCWNMYPKMWISESGRSVKLISWFGRDTGIDTPIANAVGSVANINTDGDWFCRQVATGNVRQPLQIDRRNYNNMEVAEFYVQRGTSGAGTKQLLEDYENIMILQEDKTHYLNTQYANMAAKFGFIGRPILDTSLSAMVDQMVVFISDAIPLIQSNKSMFIRLDNFTQRSLNAGTGRPSKILYHIPRFDQSNREVGAGLYYEPQERVYVRLFNTEQLVINEFDLSICDNKEVLVEDLSGQTIICLHVRPSSMPLNTAITGGRRTNLITDMATAK